jgi:hypothetical protein
MAGRLRRWRTPVGRRGLSWRSKKAHRSDSRSQDAPRQTGPETKRTKKGGKQRLRYRPTDRCFAPAFAAASFDQNSPAIPSLTAVFFFPL